MLTKQMHQMNMIFVIIGVLKILILTMLLLFLLKEVIIEVIFWYISKHDTINIMKNSNLNEKSGLQQIFLLYIKMVETTYYQRNREILKEQKIIMKLIKK